MRNLKRVLSLALASVMLLGMMVIGAGAADKTAADLTDMDKVTNKEAVSLMVDLGIIEGKPDGSFAPTEGVDRATMAKLITYILMGDVDASIFEGTTTDLTDIDTNWAEGYIKYCYANGIISGDGQGHFFPTQGVTVVQAAKMLLVALGYDATASKYQGDSMWSVNIMKDAQAAGLINNMSVKATDTLTRDGAAQMIYNALFAKTVTPEFQYDMGVQYLSKYVSAPTTLGEQVYGLAKVEALVSNIPANGDAVLVAAPGTTPAAGAINAANAAKFAVSPEQAGTVVTFYTKNTVSVNNGVVSYTFKELYSTSLSAGTSTVLATVNNGIADFDKAADKSNKSFVASVETNGNAYSATFFINGVAETITTATVGTFTDAEFEASIAKKGSIVEFVDTNNNGLADVVKVTEKKVATLTADPATKVVGDATQVIVPGVINAYSAANTTETVKGYTDLKKGDVVLYVQIGKVTYIEKAASVQGVVAGKHSDKGILVDGTYYLDSGLFNASNSWNNDYTNTYTFYLDNASNIVKAVKDTDKATDSSYAVVLANAWVNGTGAIGESAYAQAQLLYADGTVEIVTVSKVNGSPASASGANNVANLTNGGFVTYTKDSDGKYELTTKAGSNVAGTTITSGAAKFDGTTVGNNATVFLVKTSDGNGKAVYTAYTGISSIPSMTLSATNKGTVVKNSAGIATYVYLDASDATLTGAVGDIVYITGNTLSYTYVPQNGSVPAYYEVNAIVNGEATTLKLKSVTSIADNSAGTTYTSAPVTKTLYEVKGKDANGIVDKLQSKNMETGITVSDGTMISSTSVLTVNADTAIYYIGTDGSVSTLSYDSVTNDATDKVYVAKKTNDVAEIVYIQQVLSNGKALTGFNYTTNNANETTVNVGASITGKTAGDVITFTAPVGLSAGATYVIDKPTVVVPASGAGNVTVTVTVTAEDGTTTGSYTITVEAQA